MDINKRNLIILILLFNFSATAFGQCENLTNCLSEVAEVSQAGNAVDGCSLQGSIAEAEEIEGHTEQEDDSKSFEFDRDSWKYALLGVSLAPGAFVLGTAIHEGSHCLAAELEGFDCYDVRVIPYKDEQTDYFYFGSMRFKWEEGNEPNAEQNALITAAPMFTNIGLVSAYSTLAFTNSLPKNKYAKTAALVLGATQVVDLFNHVRNTHPLSDSGKLMHYFETKHNLNPKQAYWAVKAPQIGAASIGLGALIIEGVRIFTIPVENKVVKDVRISPQYKAGGFHLGISGKF